MPAIVTAPSSTGQVPTSFLLNSSLATVSKNVAFAPHAHDASPSFFPTFLGVASALPSPRATLPARQRQLKLLSFNRSISPVMFTLWFLIL